MKCRFLKIRIPDGRKSKSSTYPSAG